MFSVVKEKRSDRFFSEIIERIESGLIRNKDILEVEKLALAKKHGIFRVVKNADIMEYAKHNSRADLMEFLRTKPVRTASGVANIAVMWKGADTGEGKFFSCPANCVYCPQGENSPKAYTGVEPTTMRAKRLGYDPWLQVKKRIKQFHIIGHKTDKCELIIMGGTFTAMPLSFQQDFVKKCFDAFNEEESPNIKEAHAKNETASNRCIGLTIETRADYCLEKHIGQMLQLGCTRVEIGVQTTSDELLEKINRGHDAQANIDAIKWLKNAGLKFTAHWMPGLTGLEGDIDAKEELRLFKQLFTPEYQPDELKIYPALVIQGTKLHEMWKAGKYKPLERNEMLDLLMKMKEAVPPHVRIKRVMRDISEHEAEAGARTTNLRQIAKGIMEKEGKKCACIRCREIGLDEASEGDVKILWREYEASGGKEIFISFEDVKKDKIIAFLRLRIDGSETAKVRELHVYGEMTPIGKKINHQHRGYGRRLMQEAEQTATENGKKAIAVTSGVGVRDYYRKLGYVLDGNYMVKTIEKVTLKT